jgi:hypothetical protein
MRRAIPPGGRDSRSNFLERHARELRAAVQRSLQLKAEIPQTDPKSSLWAQLGRHHRFVNTFVEFIE